MNGLFFPSYWEFHNPNWRSPSFFRGWQKTTNQIIYILYISIKPPLNSHSIPHKKPPEECGGRGSHRAEKIHRQQHVPWAAKKLHGAHVRAVVGLGFHINTVMDRLTMDIPSGKRLHSYWKLPFSSLIYPLIAWWFSIVVLVYQRV